MQIEEVFSKFSYDIMNTIKGLWGVPAHMAREFTVKAMEIMHDKYGDRDWEPRHAKSYAIGICKNLSKEYVFSEIRRREMNIEYTAGVFCKDTKTVSYSSSSSKYLPIEELVKHAGPYADYLLDFYTQRMTLKEISIKYNVNINTLKYHMRKSREQIRKALEDNLENAIIKQQPEEQDVSEG